MPIETSFYMRDECQLVWRVHLLRRYPERLPALALVLFIGCTCVWLLFGRAAPVLTACILLLGEAADYLVPITYRITPKGMTVNSLTAHMALSWKDARRCLRDPIGLIVTPLPTSSRLDRFRGLVLRYAPDGEPGDRASVLEAIIRYAPHLAVPCQTATGAADDAAGSPAPDGGRH